MIPALWQIYKVQSSLPTPSFEIWTACVLMILMREFFTKKILKTLLTQRLTWHTTLKIVLFSPTFFFSNKDGVPQTNQIRKTHQELANAKRQRNLRVWLYPFATRDGFWKNAAGCVARPAAGFPKDSLSPSLQNWEGTVRLAGARPFVHPPTSREPHAAGGAQAGLVDFGFPSHAPTEERIKTKELGARLSGRVLA